MWNEHKIANLANQGQVILLPEFRNNALLISQSGSSNFALYTIKYWTNKAWNMQQKYLLV
jgi:hypothetical protein